MAEGFVACAVVCDLWVAYRSALAIPLIVPAGS
jgi:hypothetical protein